MAPQILVLGMPRTGTQSIGEALRILGHGPTYHMSTVGPNNHHDIWATALETKFEGTNTTTTTTTTPLDKTLFDSLFRSYTAVSDFPASIFYRELLAAYPTAHVILSTRPEDAWLASMRATLHTAFVKAKATPSRLARLYHRHMWADDLEANGRSAFRAHNAGVLRAAAEMGRPVLVFDPEQGWGPLCEFLGKTVPEVAYPRKDAWQGYKMMLKEVEAGRLTEDAITVGGGVRGMESGKEGIKEAYIYTQQKEGEEDMLRSTGEGIKSAYIYTQQKEDEANEILRSNGEGIRSAYIYTQQKEEGIRSAYIYTQQKENDVNELLRSGEGIRSAYICTQQKENDGHNILRATKEGIKAAYIYTQ